MDLILNTGHSGLTATGQIARKQMEKLMFQLFEMLNALRNISADKRGVTALEYGLIAALIAGVIVTIFTTFGGNLTTAFSGIGSALTR